MNNVLQNSIQDAKNVDISKYNTGSNGSLSFSIVNSTDNGKRVTFSKSLLKTLGADKNIELLISPQNKTVITGVNLIALDESLNPCILTLRKGGIAYKSDIVKAISKILSVDFAKHTSYTFRDIEIIEESGTSVALIMYQTQFQNLVMIINFTYITDCDNRSRSKIILKIFERIIKCL